jgi:hypothetical protein
MSSISSLPSVLQEAGQDDHQQQQPLFHEDALCVGCREQTVRKGKHASQSCGSLIYKHLQQLPLQQQQQQQPHGGNNNSTQYNHLILEATQNVLKMFQNQDNDNECHLCRPPACREENKRYGYPDTVAPRVLHAQTLLLPSIPQVHRVPHPQVTNWTDYFSNTSHVHPHRTYFFEYNPSLVQIPRHQIPTNILTPQQVAETVYLASFRVTNTQQCVHGPDELLMIGGQWPRPKSQDYLGLALLRHDLSIIVDVVLDKNSNSPNNSVLQAMEDYRLFVLNEQIYVASYHRIVPLWLVAPPFVPNAQEDADVVVPLDNKFPSILTVHARTFASCAGNNGKNINYFVDSHNNKTGTAGVVVAEMYPMLGKMAVNLHEPCTPAATSPRNQKRKIKAAAEPQQQQQQVVRHNATLPLHKSFGSYEEIHFFNHGAFSTMSQERGSACCVPIPNPTTTAASNSSSSSSSYLLLGISHSKTKFRTAATRDSLPGNVSANHFFSAFYAMEPHEPYTVRARSGRFCLGFSDVNETIVRDDDHNNNNNNNPYARSNMVRLRLGGNHYDCPRIHFVSGMVEKANDPSRIIIAYGIQDCAPRFIEVAKQQILEMLFPDLFRKQ